MEAAGVTAARVRCSAWLGVFAWDSPEIWGKSLEEVALAGDDRTGGGRKVESRSRMALRRDEKAGDVERRGRPKGEIVAARAARLNREGMTPRSGVRVAQEAWKTGIS